MVRGRTQLIASVFLFAGCAPPEPGASATFDDFCDAKYDRPPGEAGPGTLTRVTIEGYPVPPKLFSLCSKTCSFDLVENADGTGRSIRYSVRMGDGKNKLGPLPERFADEEFKLRTQSDELLGFGDRVRLTGERLGTAKEADCQLYDVDLIEKP